MLCRRAVARLSLMLHQLLGNVEDMMAGQPHVGSRRVIISYPCLTSEDYLPPKRQRRNSSEDSRLRTPPSYLRQTGARITDRLSLIGALLGTYDILLLRVCPSLRTRVSLPVSTVRSTTERDDSGAVFASQNKHSINRGPPLYT